MLNKFFLICLFLTILEISVQAQSSEIASIQIIKKEIVSLPGDIVNIPFFIKNNTENSTGLLTDVILPEGWNRITKPPDTGFKPGEQKFAVYSLQIPSNYPVGTYPVIIQAKNLESGKVLAEEKSAVTVNEIEKITMDLIDSKEHIFAGENLGATYLIQNLGNTTKRIFIETSNCDVSGNPEIKLEPGESSTVKVIKQTSADLTETKKEYYTVRTVISGNIKNSIFRSTLVFPVKNSKKDLFFRYPVSASATYLATNRDGHFQAAYQFELSGNGPLDPAGKHYLEFLARGPNSSNLNFLGLYDQYYISYINKNLELSVGEKSYNFTPLTESSRFGLGVESKLKLNNGLSVGYLYVKPRFYEDISNEMGFYTQFEKDLNNLIQVYYITKKNEGINDLTHLMSINTKFSVRKKTNFDLEFSRGLFQGTWDNAFRTSINTQFSIFSMAGYYSFAGKNYPGYYKNTTFYSVNFSAQLTNKLSTGIYARQDFSNAQLDTFFITAPYSKSIQYILNYKIAKRSFLKFYWRDSERKDRLVQDKFHYKTQSLNTAFNQKFKKIEYSLLGEYGKTTNYLLESLQNKQNTYRGTVNFGYNFNSLHTFRVFGSWSNVNSFVSGEQRNLTAGLSVNSQIAKNLHANFNIQNAYDIDDYYRNRNLMQLNVDYKFLRNHTITLRSFYTIFRQQIDNPEFTMSATYAYKFGVPLKQVIKAGEILGRITNDNEEPLEGVILNVLNKTAITNKNGEFNFKAVSPGRYLLIVDRSNFEIDEIPGIPSPIEIDVVENQQSNLNFKITKGAKLTGQFVISENEKQSAANSTIQLGNIIVELKSDFEQFRIISDKNGRFSFPIILPGNWSLRVYSNSLPNGFELEKDVYNLNFTPGEKLDLVIDLNRKKRNIIFKTQSISLSNNAESANQPIKLSTKPKSDDDPKIESPIDNTYFSIQIGAYKKKQNANSKSFIEHPFDFEKQSGKLYLYFIGRFNTREKAKQELEKIKTKYKGAFIVTFINDKKQ